MTHPRRVDEGPLSIAFLGDPGSVHLRRWAGHFAARGHAIAILVPDRTIVAPGLPDGVTVHRFHAGPRGRARPLGAVVVARSLRRTLRRLDPDVLHVHHLTTHGWRAWLSGFRPYIVTVWGSDVLLAPHESPKARLLARIGLRGAALVTGGSHHLVSAAIAAGARPSRTRYVHFGVDIERFSVRPAPAALRSRLGLEGRRVVFSPRTIGRLYRQDVVLEASARLPDDVVLMMTRHLAKPAELAMIEARAAELGLGRRLVLLPSVPHAEMPDHYALADVVVSVPASDGGPNTVVEALASGRPIVASDLPPNREWLADLDPEALVPVGDVDATETALRRILERPDEERTERAAEARRRVEATADQRRTMAEMERLYRQVAAHGRVTQEEAPDPGGAAPSRSP
jgi:glycosyltransferase involved in cell wall biosynthesis